MRFLMVLVAVASVCSAQFGGFQSKAKPQQQLRAQAPLKRQAAPARASASDQAASVLVYDSDISPDGAFTYRVETDNGISASAQGNADSVQGSYSWTAPEGLPVAISYVADANGYQPSGDVLPTPPPVPPQIARALEWLAKNAPANQDQK